MDRLISNFHSLPGDTLREKRRSFNALLNQIKDDVTSEDDSQVFISSLIAMNKLEEILKIEILIHLQRYDALLDVLKCGRPMLIKKVLNCWQFFQVTFQNINARTLINEIFPHTSFSTRTKMITKLSANLRNETRADEYFQALEETYGLQVARGILPACSISLIKATVDEYKLKLTNRQLLQIIKKHPGFISYYFEILYAVNKEFEFSKEYAHVLKHVAKVDAPLYWKLSKKYDLQLQFGRHTTTSMYEEIKEDFFKNKNLKCFGCKNVYKVVKKDQEKICKILVSLCPKRVDDFYKEYLNRTSRLRKFADCLPRSRRYEVLSKCFRETYGMDLHDFGKQIHEDIMKIMPVTEREKILDGDLGGEKFIYMYPPSKSMAWIKERINNTSSGAHRRTLVKQLYDTCRFHEDEGALLDALNLIQSKHKSDGFCLGSFMNELASWPRIEQLSTAHWTVISDLLKVLLLENSRSFNSGINFLTGCFIHLVDNNISPEEFVKILLQYIKDNRGYYNLFLRQPKYDRLSYELFAPIFPEVFKGETYHSSCVSFLAHLAYYNNHNPKSRITISDYPKLMESLKTLLDNVDQYSVNDQYCAYNTIRYCVQYEHDKSALCDELLWKHYKEVLHPKVVIWYIRNKPQKLLDNFDKVIEEIPRLEYSVSSSEILKQLSLLSFTGIPDKITAFAVETLRNENVAKANFAVKALSYLSSDEKYLDVTKPFYPASDGKIQTKNLRDSRVTLQETIVECLLNLDKPSTYLPLLMKFCVGDYLKFALRPLYRVIIHIPEQELAAILDSLYKSAVSVRKHALHLITLVSKKDTVYNFLKQTGETDRNASLKKAIFKSTLRFFAANPSPALWDLFKSNIKILDKDDKEAFSYLVNLKRIPYKYLSQYIPIAYEVLSTNNNKEIQKLKYDLLNSIPEGEIDNLNEDFLEKTISDSLFNPKYDDPTKYCFKCLFSSTGEKQTKVLDLVFKVLKKYLNENWSSVVCRHVNNFLHDFCQKSIALDVDEELITKFSKSWSLILNNKKLQEHNLLLQFTAAYISCPPENKLREFGIKANQVCDDWIDLYNASVIRIFIEKLDEFLGTFLRLYEDEENIFAFIDSFLCAKKAAYTYIVVLNLLERVTSVPTKVTYDSILAEISQSKVGAVQVHLKRYLLNATCN